MIAPPENTPIVRPQFDESEAPLIVVRYPVVATDDSIQFIFSEYRRIANKYKRVVWLVDMRTFNPITAPASIRRSFVEEYENSRGTISAATIAEARIFSSPIVRGIATAVDWLLKQPYPVKGFDTDEPALAWARKYVEAERQKKTGLNGFVSA